MKITFTSWKLLAVALFFSTALDAQTAGDYRSIASGNWSNIAIWETFDGTSWVPAVATPTSADGVITIGANDTLDIAVTADQLVVSAGDTLVVNSNASNLTLNDGAGTDLLVNGVLVLTGDAFILGAGNTEIALGGVLEWDGASTLQSVTTIDSAGVVNLTGNVTRTLAANFTNNGIVNWSTGASGGGIFFNNAIFTNNDTINENFSSNRGIFPVGGVDSFINNGVFLKLTFNTFNNFDIPVVNSSTGSFQGYGGLNITTNFKDTGTISPGFGPTGGSDFIGILNVSPETFNTNSPTVVFQIADGSGGGSGHDSLFVTGTGNIDLTGTSLVVTENSSTPVQTYVVMATEFGTFTGTFKSVSIPLGYTVIYTATQIILSKNGVTLPVVWGDFNALAYNKQVKLNWSTLQESNASNYIVEHSIDGRSFAAIATVAAKGNSSTITQYSFVHTSPSLLTNNSYRIRQVDRDGKVVYSVIRNVRFSKGKLIAVLVTPNPVRSTLQLSTQGDNISVKLTDLSGKVFKILSLKAGVHDVNVQDLPAGIYQLIIYQNQQRIDAQQIIKVN